MSDSLQPHGLQPTRHLGPWDSPGKNTGVGCCALLLTHTHIYNHVHSAAKSLQSCPTLCDPIDGSPPYTNPYLYSCLGPYPSIYPPACQCWLSPFSPKWTALLKPHATWDSWNAYKSQTGLDPVQQASSRSEFTRAARPCSASHCPNEKIPMAKLYSGEYAGGVLGKTRDLMDWDSSCCC